MEPDYCQLRREIYHVANFELSIRSLSRRLLDELAPHRGDPSADALARLLRGTMDVAERARRLLAGIAEMEEEFNELGPAVRRAVRRAPRGGPAWAAGLSLQQRYEQREARLAEAAGRRLREVDQILAGTAHVLYQAGGLHAEVLERGQGR